MVLPTIRGVDPRQIPATRACPVMGGKTFGVSPTSRIDNFEGDSLDRALESECGEESDAQKQESARDSQLL